MPWGLQGGTGLYQDLPILVSHIMPWGLQGGTGLYQDLPILVSHIMLGGLKAEQNCIRTYRFR